MRVIGAFAGEAADFAKRPRVDEAADALADGQPAGRMLALNLVDAAHLGGHAFANAQFVEFRLPPAGWGQPDASVIIRHERFLVPSRFDEA